MDQEMRFGGRAGEGIPNLPQTPEEFRRRYASRIDNRPFWVAAMEAAFVQLTATPEGKQQYGDPDRGATLPQAWRTVVAISGIFNVCLLVQGRPATPTEGIRNVVSIAPADLVRTLARGFATIQNFTAQLFVHDGRSGHCVTALGHDPAGDKIRYHDPWPDRSLLCLEFNLAGVDAQPRDDGSWEITGDELQRVVFAAFVDPTSWADLTGQAYRISYDDLRKGDFFGFFHLRETGRTPVKERQITLTLEPGGFRENVRLQLLLDLAGVVRGGTLMLRRSWVVSRQSGVDPFAQDIARSFLAALLPGPDLPAAKEIPDAIAGLREKPVIDALLARREAADLSGEEKMQLTYLGLLQESTELFTFCRIEGRNVQQKRTAWLVLEVALH